MLELNARLPREVARRDAIRLRCSRRPMDSEQAGCARVITTPIDALLPAGHGPAIAAAFEELGGVDLVIVAAGVLGERERSRPTSTAP